MADSNPPEPVAAAERQALFGGGDGVGTRAVAQGGRGGADAEFQAALHRPVLVQSVKHAGRQGVTGADRSHDLRGRHAHSRLPDELTGSRARADAFGEMDERPLPHAAGNQIAGCALPSIA